MERAIIDNRPRRAAIIQPPTRYNHLSSGVYVTEWTTMEYQWQYNQHRSAFLRNEACVEAKGTHRKDNE